MALALELESLKKLHAGDDEEVYALLVRSQSLMIEEKT